VTRPEEAIEQMKSGELNFKRLPTGNSVKMPQSGWDRNQGADDEDFWYGDKKEKRIGRAM
jgi:hypothetical protein